MHQLLVTGRVLGLLSYKTQDFLFREHDSFTVTPPKREWFFPLSMMPDIRNAGLAGIITRKLVAMLVPSGQRGPPQSSANSAVLEFGAGNQDLAMYVPLLWFVPPGAMIDAFEQTAESD